MTRDEAQAAVKEHGGIKPAARALKIPYTTLRGWLHGTGESGNRARRTPAPMTAGRSLDEFRHTYDKSTIIPARIKEGLSKLGSGWEYEVAFAKLAGVSLSDLGNFRDQFAAHVVTLRESRRAWAGTKATAGKMREML